MLLEHIPELDPPLSSTKLTAVVHPSLVSLVGFQMELYASPTLAHLKENCLGSTCPNLINHLFDCYVASMVILLV